MHKVYKHKVYKNGICPCGSGEKYKDCCFKQTHMVEQNALHHEPLTLEPKTLEG